MRLALLLAGSLLFTGCHHRNEGPPPAEPAAEQAAAQGAVQADAGAPLTAEAQQRARGEACDSDAQCGPGMVCQGCGENDRICLPGCRQDSDCSHGETCHQVQCIRCPCPPLCQAG